MKYDSHREIAPFFEDAINQVFLQPQKQMYIMDGPVGMGKTTNFLMLGSYRLSQDVQPNLVGTMEVRESLWVMIRESETTTLKTLMEALEALFPPELIHDPKGPVKKRGKHPVTVSIEHGLSDGTFLKMHIECHGFNNEKAESRLRSRGFLGALIPEIQSIPWSIAEVARQRTGRWRTTSTWIKRTINGVPYTLTGTQNLKIVLADANIPKRPHPMYEVLYDVPDLRDTPYTLLTPPPPIRPVPVDEIPNKAVLDVYPTTRYEKQDVVWLPNPKCYSMTRHFESYETDPITGLRVEDEHGVPKKIPWSGYSYWFNEVNQPDHVVTRLVLGKPLSIGGDSAIYKNFDKQKMVKRKPLREGVSILVGYDPGYNSGFLFMQDHGNNKLHVFKELVFTHADGLNTREQIKGFFKPMLDNEFKGFNVITTPDPASTQGFTMGEGPLYILKEAGIQVDPCLVMNQHVEVRRESLGYYITKGLLTVDPQCSLFIKGLLGDYRFTTNRQGIISDDVDKRAESNHIVEAGQYAITNLYKRNIAPDMKRAGTNSAKILKLIPRRGS